MRISQISILNMAAFATFETAVPAVCLIEGANGAGKTSLLNCVRYAFARGHDPDIIHGEAEYGEIIITFDDGSQVKARASRKTNETTRGWKAPGAKKFTVTREQIDAIAKAISYDPLGFMAKTEQQQLQTLLEIMPVEVDVDAMVAAIGDAGAEAAFAPVAGKNGLETIAAVHRTIYDARTGYNTAADTQEKHALTLEAALPPPAPGENWGAEVARIAAEKAGLEDSERKALGVLGADFQAAKDGAAERLGKEQTAIDADASAAIKALQAQIREVENAAAARKGAALVRAAESIEYARGIANQEGVAIKAENAPRLAALASELATAQERARAHQQAEGTRKAVQVARQEAAARRKQSAAMTAALDRLAALKADVAAKLPIPGVTFEDGRIVNAAHVPFVKWNTEAQVVFCLRIGVLAHGSAGFICIDGGERLDEGKFAGVIKVAKKYAASEKGLQFLISRVGAGTLAVTEA